VGDRESKWVFASRVMQSGTRDIAVSGSALMVIAMEFYLEFRDLPRFRNSAARSDSARTACQGAHTGPERGRFNWTGRFRFRN
jgi:hypothetical protein